MNGFLITVGVLLFIGFHIVSVCWILDFALFKWGGFKGGLIGIVGIAYGAWPVAAIVAIGISADAECRTDPACMARRAQSCNRAPTVMPMPLIVPAPRVGR